MTGRERTIRALNFEPVDRTPVAGGLLLAPSSSTGPEVPWENVDAMCDDVSARVP